MVGPYLIMDVQLLARSGVIIVHILRDIHIYPVQLIHQGNKTLGVHQDIVVHRDAEGVLDLLLQGLRAGAVEGGVDLGVFGPGAVYCGVPGNGDHPHRLRHSVIAGQDDGISVAALHVLAQQSEGIDAVLPHQGIGILLRRGGRLPGLAAGGRGRIRLCLRDLRGANGQMKADIGGDDDGGDDHQDHVQAEPDAVPPAFDAPPCGLHPPSA